MNAQFQLCLELTNLLNPITSTISTLGSLALVKAIRDAGSDYLTEVELASWLGRNRIDPAMLVHFRQIVGKSEQNKLAEYLEIVLHAGAGPTVQNALKNPELLSMVIQLSLLCSIFQTDSLAHAIVEAIRENMNELGMQSGAVPNYASLCGTLRVCKQETVDFQWQSLFTALEKKVESALGPTSAKFRDGSIYRRKVPFPILRVLLLSLHSLQHFPDERCLHIRCDEGISTIIVWCYYVLGLNVQLNYQGHYLVFGVGSPNVFILESQDEPCFATLLHPGGKNEPLFRLTTELGQPELQLEPRRLVRGFGNEMIRLNYSGEFSTQQLALWVIGHAIHICEDEVEPRYQPFRRGVYGYSGWTALEMTQKHDLASDLKNNYVGFTETNIIRAGKLLFDLESIDDIIFQKDALRYTLEESDMRNLSIPISLLLSFSRVKSEDLEACGCLPLSVISAQRIEKFHRWGVLREIHNPWNWVPGLIQAFEYLSAFLEGRYLLEAIDENAVLTSSCGWSLYFDSFCALDPSEVKASTLRLVRGVPVRDGVRREKIFDGPTSKASSVQPTGVDDPCDMLFYGSHDINRGRYLYGYRGSNAFELTQVFESRDSDKSRHCYLLGYRQMQELVVQFRPIPHCGCNGNFLSFREVAKNYIDPKDNLEQNTPKIMTKTPSKTTYDYFCCEENGAYRLSTNGPLSEHLSHHRRCGHCALCERYEFKDYGNSRYFYSTFYYVDENPAARWLQLCKIIGDNELDAVGFSEEKMYFLRGRDSCFQCTVRHLTLKPNRKELGLEHDHIPVRDVYVLL